MQLWHTIMDPRVRFLASWHVYAYPSNDVTTKYMAGDGIIGDYEHNGKW